MASARVRVKGEGEGEDDEGVLMRVSVGARGGQLVDDHPASRGNDHAHVGRLGLRLGSHVEVEPFEAAALRRPAFGSVRRGRGVDF